MKKPTGYNTGGYICKAGASNPPMKPIKKGK